MAYNDLCGGSAMLESERQELIRDVTSLARARGRQLDVEHDVLKAMPEDFVLRYEMLWLKAFGKAIGGGVVGPPANPTTSARRVTRLSTGQTETRGAAKSGGRAQGVSTKDTIANEAAMAFKSKVDRKLRALSREMRLWLSHGATDRAGMRRCTKCKRWGEDTWVWCPWDREPMVEAN